MAGQVKVLQLNVNGLAPRCAELRKYITRNPKDVICLQETKLLPTKNDIYLPGYTCQRRDRPGSTTRGGGLAIYVSDNLNYISVSLT